MKTWPIQDAKNQFSHVVNLAKTKGPQTVTKHGEAVAVIISINEFRKTQKPRETPYEFFSRFRGAGIDLTRNKELPRNIEL
jgi:antitoxin Phd